MERFDPFYLFVSRFPFLKLSYFTEKGHFFQNYQARKQSARARRACTLRALGLLLADGTPTVGGGIEHNCTIFLCSLDVRNIVQGGDPLYAVFFSTQGSGGYT